MVSCDSHVALYGTPQMISEGEGFLFAMHFMQNSEIQEKTIERAMETDILSMSREEMKSYIESRQGSDPWIICEKCVGSLNLGSYEVAAARDAAIKWWNDKSSPGHMPSSDTSLSPKKPSHFLISGNGFTPSEDQARLIIAAWVKKRKNILGEGSSVGVKYIFESLPQTSRDVFFKIISDVQSKNPDQTIDDVIMLDQKTGKDAILIAIWAPEDSDYINSLLHPNTTNEKKEKESSTKSGCFIATACYGSPYFDNVILLQQFRDEHLTRSEFGKKFILFYYKISPSIAKFIIKKSFLNKFVKHIIIEPIVIMVKIFGNYQSKLK